MPEKMTLHFKDGSTTSMDAIDARRVLREHSSEWQTSPFPEDVQKASKAEADDLALYLAKLRAEGKTELEVERARHAFPELYKAHKARSAETPKPAAPVGDPVPPYTAKEKTAGWWGIFDANGAQVGGNMRKPEAESFNGLSDEDKAEYVKAELAKG